MADERREGEEKTERTKEKKTGKGRRAGEPRAAVDVTYKVLLLGDSGVGKTALIRRLMRSEFKLNHLTTVGIDFVKKVFSADGAQVELQVWDTAGQERFRSITKFQYRNTKGLLLVYDVTNMDSFETLGYWLDSIDNELDMNNKEPVPVFIIGNKTDLEAERVVTTEMGRKAAESHYVHGFLETSAKDGTNVDEAFTQLAHAAAEVFSPDVLDLYLDPEGQEERNKRRQAVLMQSLRRKKKRMGKVQQQMSCIKLTPDSEVKKASKASKCSCG